ncbi:Fic family protein [Denitrobacterium detoxificans]|uniref:Fic family protein n=1 Tax=Denitrobacterium detoxificans TaxID=79604 RepID=UPI0026EA60D6|nr:Fic family protein [Denitrobacterium detoxificans]MBE6466946.1 Fic family protein [Denitrobacterium detoxificans]
MWPQVEYETLPWHRDDDALAYASKTQRRKIQGTYEAALPAHIANLDVDLNAELSRRAEELMVSIARYDQEQANRAYNLPALMLRSESSSSSQIERLTSSARNVALAELSDKTSQNAQLIAANIAAMREALAHEGEIDVPLIIRIHDTLVAGTDAAAGIRTEQVWIGGSFYSPHGAVFVPPHHSRISSYLDDLVAFSAKEDISPLVKAAIFHAQFETIHPFTDGNGRTGRALLHAMLAWDDVLRCATIPLSAGLLSNVDAYMAALDAYHDGHIEPIVEQLLDAVELAIALGAKMSAQFDALLNAWNESFAERKGAKIYELPALLVEQPVVNTAYVAKRLGISDRAARDLIAKACDYGILSKMGNARRGAFYQAPELIEIIEEASSAKGLLRAKAR